MTVRVACGLNRRMIRSCAGRTAFAVNMQSSRESERSELHPEPQEVRGWIRRLWMTRGKGPIAKVAEGGISRGRESRGGSGRIG